jgi:hypothetical protein
MNDLPLEWRTGIDLTKDIHTGRTSAEIYMRNSEKGQAMAGGPVCTYNGADIPCFVCASPKASITTELLIEMLVVIDKTSKKWRK